MHDATTACVRRVGGAHDAAGVEHAERERHDASATPFEVQRNLTLAPHTGRARERYSEAGDRDVDGTEHGHRFTAVKTVDLRPRHVLYEPAEVLAYGLGAMHRAQPAPQIAA